jgi:signal transduction histidine kinase
MKWGGVRSFALALVLPGLALWATSLLEPWLAGTVLPPTFAAVVAAALYGGLGAGLLAVLVGAVGLKWLFLPPVHTLAHIEASSAVRLVMFVALGVVLCTLGASLHRRLNQEQGAHRAARADVRAREQLLAAVSHDLRSPLASLLLQVEMLLRTVDHEPAHTQACLQRVRRAAFLMHRLVSDLLDFAMTEAGQLAIEVHPVRITALLAEACAMAEPSAKPRNIRLHRHFPDLELEVSCDGDRILQVVSNLVGNAIKFSPSGSAIAVRMTELDDELIVAVTDDGPGVPASDLPHLFEPYWRADRLDRRGVGLGLPISKAIIESHGGRIWIESEPGAGTRASFALPVRRPDAAPRSRPEASRDGWRNAGMGSRGGA